MVSQILVKSVGRGRVILKVCFPRLFFASSKKEECLRDMFSIDGKSLLFKCLDFFGYVEVYL